METENLETQNLRAEMRELKELIDENALRFSHRPNLSTKSAKENLHQKALDQYIRKGDEAEIRSISIEGKGLSSGVNSEGGFLLAPETSAIIENKLNEAASLRVLANVVDVEATSYDFLIDHGEFQSGWVEEASVRDETSIGELSRISIALHELSAMPKSTQRLLDDAAFDIETWLSERIAESFFQSESAAFIHGDGINKPKGLLAHTKVDQGAWTWGNVGVVKTGVAGDFDGDAPGDAVIDLVYALPARYRQNATFLMNSKTAGAVRKMKDGDGRFLWSDCLSADDTARLLGYRVFICEDMPDVADGQVAIAFGDFSSAYTIAQRPDMRILRDPFSAKPHVLFYATKRVGGDVTNFEAYKLLEFSAHG